MNDLFSVPISITSAPQALATVSQWLTERLRDKGQGTRGKSSTLSPKPLALIPKIVVTPNPEMIVAAQSDPEFLKALQSADLAIPDGIGVVWALKLLRDPNNPNKHPNYPNSEHSDAFVDWDRFHPLSGLDLMESLIAVAAAKGWRVMLLGGKPGVAAQAAAKLRLKLETRNSKLEINPNDQNSKSKMVSDFGFRISDFRIRPLSGLKDITQTSKTELDELINSINRFRPDLLFVAFGHGKQEKWLNANRHRLNVGVAMGVGGALDQIADPSLRPSAYINSIGLGWLYRLLREPWRWRRQLALIKFAGIVLQERLKS